MSWIDKCRKTRNKRNIIDGLEKLLKQRLEQIEKHQGILRATYCKKFRETLNFTETVEYFSTRKIEKYSEKYHKLLSYSDE